MVGEEGLEGGWVEVHLVGEGEAIGGEVSHLKDGHCKQSMVYLLVVVVSDWIGLE